MVRRGYNLEFMEQVSPFALTTLQRVKDLLFDPNKFVALTGCTLMLNSTDVTGVTVPAGRSIIVGQPIAGTGIPAGTTIAAIISATEITLSQPATAANTNQILNVTDQPTAYDTLLTRLINSATNYLESACGRHFVKQTYTQEVYSIANPRQDTLQLRNFPVFTLTSFQWRAGTPSNPAWTDFIPDQFELINPTPNPINTEALYYPSGMIRVYGVLPRLYNNMIRATYTGGFPVDWANAENFTTHMLPGDITYACEKMVERWFARRGQGGKSSEALAGATTSWRNSLDQEVLDIIGQYKDIKF